MAEGIAMREVFCPPAGMSDSSSPASKLGWGVMARIRVMMTDKIRFKVAIRIRDQG